MSKYFLTDFEISKGRGNPVLAIKLEDDTWHKIYGRLDKKRGKWIGNFPTFGPKYCYYVYNEELYKANLNNLSFGFYTSENFSVDEEPAYYESICKW